MTTMTEELDAIARALQEQNEAWRRVEEAAAQLGSAVLAVPEEALERVDAATRLPAIPGTPGVRG